MATKVVNKNDASFDVYIGRGSIWGNPFQIGRDGTREEVLKKYEEWLNFLIKDDIFLKHLETLYGKTLGCFCKPLPCHGDILAKYAESYNEYLHHQGDENEPQDGCCGGGCGCHTGAAAVEDIKRAEREEYERSIGGETTKGVLPRLPTVANSEDIL